MISEFFIALGENFMVWFLGLFGDGEPPEWLTQVSGFFAEVFARAAGLGAWIPFAVIGIVAAALLALWFPLWGVKGIRWLWGLTPFSGGS
jgi:hypothetical protein